ncbi:MAG TPA: glycosyltransferase family 1 protein [Gemmatimonadaceae bacterium]|nr:glycosyltransferase family 1 protein [Gemmatimonadaceae bacterium]
MTTGMRIGVDATCWANTRGYGRFARELLRAMVAEPEGNTFVCFVDDRAAASLDLVGTHVEVVRVAQTRSPTQAASADGNRSVGDMLRLTRAVARERLDVFFSPTVYTYFPLPPSLPAVITFHDAIADRFPTLTLPSLRARLFWRAKVRLALAQSRLVLTVSDYAARDIEQTLGVPKSRLRVAVEAAAAIYRPSESRADVAAMASRIGLPNGARWFIYVGGFNPHKHVDLLVRAHASLVSESKDPPLLVLVGEASQDPFHGATSHVVSTIAMCGTEEQVRWTGYLSDEDLRHLLTGAIALALPSECEGFGLPAVEAAACGTPVVATTESPLPQLLEGGGIFVAPRDLPGLTNALRTLDADRATRDAMGSRALVRAQALSWPRAARVALGALREVA